MTDAEGEEPECSPMLADTEPLLSNPYPALGVLGAVLGIFSAVLYWILHVHVPAGMKALMDTHLASTAILVNQLAVKDKQVESLIAALRERENKGREL